MKVGKFTKARFFDARPKTNGAKKTLIAGSILLGFLLMTYPQYFWAIPVVAIIGSVVIGIIKLGQKLAFRKIRDRSKPQSWVSEQIASGPHR
jgi:hypothetical protein